VQKIVYFVRHGQSEGNVSPIFQPLESPLTGLGREQAAIAAKRLGKISFQALISSPLPRTKETAEIVSRATGVAAEYSDLFVERKKPTGVIGKSLDNPEASKVWREWEESLFISGKKVEDGENFDEIAARAEAALLFLRQRPEKTIVVVTHGFFLRTLIAKVILADSFSQANHRNIQTRATMDNTGISAIKYSRTFDDEHWRLWIYNDRTHLG